MNVSFYRIGADPTYKDVMMDPYDVYSAMSTNLKVISVNFAEFQPQFSPMELEAEDIGNDNAGRLVDPDYCYFDYGGQEWFCFVAWAYTTTGTIQCTLAPDMFAMNARYAKTHGELLFPGRYCFVKTTDFSEPIYEYEPEIEPKGYSFTTSITPVSTSVSAIITFSATRLSRVIKIGDKPFDYWDDRKTFLTVGINFPTYPDADKIQLMAQYINHLSTASYISIGKTLNVADKEWKDLIVESVYIIPSNLANFDTTLGDEGRYWFYFTDKPEEEKPQDLAWGFPLNYADVDLTSMIPANICRQGKKVTIGNTTKSITIRGDGIQSIRLSAVQADTISQKYLLYVDDQVIDMTESFVFPFSTSTSTTDIYEGKRIELTRIIASTIASIFGVATSGLAFAQTISQGVSTKNQYQKEQEIYARRKKYIEDWNKEYAGRPYFNEETGEEGFYGEKPLPKIPQKPTSLSPLNTAIASSALTNSISSAIQSATSVSEYENRSFDVNYSGGSAGLQNMKFYADGTWHDINMFAIFDISPANQPAIVQNVEMEGVMRQLLYSYIPTAKAIQMVGIPKDYNYYEGACYNFTTTRFPFSGWPSILASGVRIWYGAHYKTAL